MTDRAIQIFLQEKEEAGLLRAIVTEGGEIVCERPASAAGRLALQALYQMVCDGEGEGEVIFTELNTVDYERRIRTAEGKNEKAESKNGHHKEGKAHRIAKHIVAEAVAMKASDFFVDTRDGTGFVSYKVNGRLIKSDIEMDERTAKMVFRAMWQRGGADWDESGPCDVTFTALDDQNQITRIRGNSLLEKTRGHAVACRLRNPKEIIPLEKAGYLYSQMAALERMAKAPGGLFVIAGPTDSGKSTTLTAMVESMPRSLRKIEVADPPEIYLDHCTHISIAGRVDGSYENLDQILSATVRQNPDVLILGEIRDKRSAAAAMSMTQQGKRVLTSLHANNCAGVPPRLNALGIDLNLLGFREFFIGCVSQNLVALICSNCCRTADQKNKDECRLLDLFGTGIRFTGAGCDQCADGTLGQTIVAQVYPLIDDPGAAYEMIRQSEFARLSTYMEKEHGVQSKHRAAMLLVRRGKVDPIDIERRIGRFPDSLGDAGEQRPRTRPRGQKEPTGEKAA